MPWLDFIAGDFCRSFPQISSPHVSLVASQQFRVEVSSPAPEEDTELVIGDDPSWFSDSRPVTYIMGEGTNLDIFVLDRVTQEVTPLTTSSQ